MANTKTNIKNPVENWIKVNEPVSGDYIGPQGLVEGVANRPSRYLESAIANISTILGFTGSAKIENIDTDDNIVASADTQLYVINNRNPQGSYSALAFDKNNVEGRRLGTTNTIKVFINNTSVAVALLNVHDISANLAFIIPPGQPLVCYWNGVDKWIGNLIPDFCLTNENRSKYNAVVSKFLDYSCRPCDIIPGIYTVSKTIKEAFNVEDNTSVTVHLYKGTTTTKTAYNSKGTLYLSNSTSNTAWSNAVGLANTPHATKNSSGRVTLLDPDLTYTQYKGNPEQHNYKTVTAESWFPIKDFVDGLSKAQVGNIDPNTTLSSLICTIHSNKPTSNKFTEYYIRTTFKSGVSLTSDRFQVAIPTTDRLQNSADPNQTGTIFIRQYTHSNGTWTTWRELGLNDEIMALINSKAPAKHSHTHQDLPKITYTSNNNISEYGLPQLSKVHSTSEVTAPTSKLVKELNDSLNTTTNSLSGYVKLTTDQTIAGRKLFVDPIDLKHTVSTSIYSRISGLSNGVELRYTNSSNTQKLLLRSDGKLLHNDKELVNKDITDSLEESISSNRQALDLVDADLLKKLNILGNGNRDSNAYTKKHNTDLNLITDTGSYFVKLSSASGSVPTQRYHYPTDDSFHTNGGLLFVSQMDNNHYFQTYYVLSQNAFYTRAKNDNVWTSWKRLDLTAFSDLQNKPTTIAGYGITDSIVSDTEPYTQTTQNLIAKEENQSRIWYIHNGNKTTLNFDDSMYNYGVGLSLMSPKGKTLMYFPHASQYIKPQLWLRSNYNTSGNNLLSGWHRIDGSDWDELRNVPNASESVKGPVTLSNSTTGSRKDVAATEFAVSEVAKKSVPLGAIVSFPHNMTAPNGFLPCNGTTFQRNTYPDLYRALGNSNVLPNLNDHADIGMLAYFPKDTAPEGWLECKGQAISRSQYPELFDYLGTTYGTSGSNRKLPDPEDRFIRNVGVNNGLHVGMKQADEIKRHVHETPLDDGSRDDPKFSNTHELPSPIVYDYNLNIGVPIDNGYSDNFWAMPKLTGRMATGGDENRPKSIAFRLFIKAKSDIRYYIKAFGAITNEGTLDASALASQLQNKADVNHKHNTSDIRNFDQAVDTRISQAITIQTIGRFQITKFPCGTMIQVYRSEGFTNNIISWKTYYEVTWAIAFVDKPYVSVTSLTTVPNQQENRSLDMIYNVDHDKSTNDKLVFWSYEDQIRQRMDYNVIAIGRWK